MPKNKRVMPAARVVAMLGYASVHGDAKAARRYGVHVNTVGNWRRRRRRTMGLEALPPRLRDPKKVVTRGRKLLRDGLPARGRAKVRVEEEARRRLAELAGDVRSKLREALAGEPKRFTTVGVRLVHTPNPTRVFTYKVRIPHQFKPGDVVPVEAAGGMLIGIVLRIDKTPKLDGPYTYKWLRHRIVELHGDNIDAIPAGSTVMKYDDATGRWDATSEGAD